MYLIGDNHQLVTLQLTVISLPLRKHILLIHFFVQLWESCRESSVDPTAHSLIRNRLFLEEPGFVYWRVHLEVPSFMSSMVEACEAILVNPIPLH